MGSIVFKSDDFNCIRKLIKKYGSSTSAFHGLNDEKERVLISISTDNITTTTFQHNGWIRTNIYYLDGTSEELFEK